MSDQTPKKITVTDGGPYRVEEGVSISDHDGNPIAVKGVYLMCRCGGSKNKPFCDGTHNSNNFNGQEFASKDTAADRRDSYIGDGVTIYDDRSRCAHAGNCTDNLASVFKLGTEPWVDANGASVEDIIRVIRTCPSGALSYTTSDNGDPEEAGSGPSVIVAVDAPYQTRGVLVESGDGQPYDLQERQALCRCGGSRNKPFCDGTHWYIGFKHQMGDENGAG
ncbi:MAG: CDGSH iron-sulfur domain-containing protein [Chloroflexi bacterium]|nr:CDGSH iron-sulfur domain-containing protein [Chloroflexota bacterium]